MSGKRKSWSVLPVAPYRTASNLKISLLCLKIETSPPSAGSPKIRNLSGSGRGIQSFASITKRPSQHVTDVADASIELNNRRGTHKDKIRDIGQI